LCFSQKPPKVKPLPPTPTIDDDAVKARQRQEQAQLAATSGRAATVDSALSPGDITGTKRVLLGV